ncbi:hypothetical protein HYT23_01200 [Candidatus Pacearchaeota archaeon]|nr:hypothetical protein [Candidatus Pacearchaeota archaeon]
MNLKQENWYDADGRNMAGYEQIQARLIFIENELDNLDEIDRAYEVGMIKMLVELIPNEASRLIWRKKIKDKLESIVKS